MGALGIPSAADVERVTRRLRSVSQRLEGIEDAIDRLEERLQSFDAHLSDKPADEQIERRLEEIARDLGGAARGGRPARPADAAGPGTPDRQRVAAPTLARAAAPT